MPRKSKTFKLILCPNCDREIDEDMWLELDLISVWGRRGEDQTRSCYCGATLMLTSNDQEGIP